MNILNLIKKEILQSVINFKGLLYMSLLPIVLMIILSTALSGQFESKTVFKELKVLYTDQSRGNFSKALENFFNESKSYGITFDKAQSNKKSFDSVKDANYVCFLNIAPNKITMYKNNRYNLEANYVEATLENFTKTYSAAQEISVYNPSLNMETTAAKNQDFVTMKPLEGKRKPTSKDYYSIAMLAMFAFYGSNISSFAINREKYEKTGRRIICSPIKRYELLIGKIIGAFLSSGFSTTIGILFSKYVLGAYWGTHIWAVILIFSAELFMSVSIGIAMALSIKSTSLQIAFLNIFPLAFSLLGGCFWSLDGINKVILAISEISPMRWVNRTSIQVVFANDLSGLPITVGLCLIISIIFITISSLLFKKEVFL